MTRTVTLTGLVLALVMADTLGQGREGTQGAAGTPAGRQGGPPRQLTIEQVKPGLYAIRLPGTGPTVAVRVTSEGVILVDSMFEANYDQILALTRTVTALPVKYVTSTHHHSDHSGGNTKFIPYAQILGHKNARAAMMGAQLPGAATHHVQH
jgi:glyoxylase-like metal-dependent hydrolase (beta-lactamase superfamily II)